jgi:Kef-type K+ transport system membrane component KefB
LLAIAALWNSMTWGQTQAPGETPAAVTAEPAATAGAESSGHQESSGHASPVPAVLLGISLLLFSAKIGGDLFDRVGFPPVLGELCIGMLLGNFQLLTGSDAFEFLKVGEAHHTLEILAEIGVVLLLFEVGLESTVKGMMQVGASSFIVATIGVVAPMILGFLIGKVFLPQADWKVSLFIGATLSATSVGITARVLKDLGRSQQTESKIILGAAVIDDVMGLIVLAVVVGIVKTGTADVMGIGKLVLSALGFLVGAVVLGTHLVAKPAFKAATYLRGHGLLVTTALVICFIFAWASSLVGLAPIVGAFAAGLILEKVQYHSIEKKEAVELEEVIKPVAALLVPLFFVQMGIKVDFAQFANPALWGLAIFLTIAAVIGKQVCAFGALEKGLDRLSIGIGMIPRGEVGLIFAREGQKLSVGGVPVVDATTFNALVFMVIATTMVTPPLLKWSMTRRRGDTPALEAAPSEA